MARIPFLAALALLPLFPVGPVGGVIAVATSAVSLSPGIGGGDNGLAYSDSSDGYLAVYSFRFNAVPTPPDDNVCAVWINAATGAAAAPITLDVTTAPTETPDVAWNGNVATKHFLVVWMKQISTTVQRVYGSVVDDHGTPVGSATAFAISDVPTFAFDFSISPVVACDGTDWFVAWDALQSDGVSPGSNFIRGRRVYGASTNAAPSLGASVVDIETGGTADVGVPVIAFGAGANYLVAWGTPNSFLYVRTVSSAGVLGTKTRLDDSPAGGAQQQRAALAASPTQGEFFAVWNTEGPDGDIKGCRVSAAGLPTSAPTELTGDVANTLNVLPWSVDITWNAATNQYFATWLESSGGPYQVRALSMSASTFAVDDDNIDLADPGISPPGMMTTATASRTGTGEVAGLWIAVTSGFIGPVQAQRYDLDATPPVSPPASPSPSPLPEDKKDDCPMTALAAGSAGVLFLSAALLRVRR